VNRPVLLTLFALASLYTAAPASAAEGRFLAKEDILVYGLALRVDPAQQTLPKGIATIVSTYLQAPGTGTVSGLPGFAPDSEVRAVLRGPSFAQPIKLSVKPNTPFNIPAMNVSGRHTLEEIRLVSGGDVLMRSTPESVTIDVIDKLLVTHVTARPLSLEEIRAKGIVFDRSNFQAYNFSAAFAISSETVTIEFPVLLPILQNSTTTTRVTQIDLSGLQPPALPNLASLVPETLKLQTQIPNLSITATTLDIVTPPDQGLDIPAIPAVIVIPGDIGLLNQYFSVMLVVGNAAPGGSNLVVTDLSADMVLPLGRDNVLGTPDDPLRMAQTTSGPSPRTQPIRQKGPDGRAGSADDEPALGPGDEGSAEFLVEGRREGSAIVELAINGTLQGLPIGPVPVTGRALGSVLVRNPKFTIAMTHPDVVSAGESYTLDVTVTNTSSATANLVSLNLFPANISGATLTGDSNKTAETLRPNDSFTATFTLTSKRTGRITAATLDADEQISGKFSFKTAVGELGVPLSPESIILPAEANSLTATLRQAAVALIGKAHAVATAPPALLPPDVRRITRAIVTERAIKVAEAGFRLSLHEPVADNAGHLALDFLGSDIARVSGRTNTVVSTATLRNDFIGFDELRRRSIRGEAFAQAVADLLAPGLTGDGRAFHQHLGELWSFRPAHVSALVTSGAATLPVRATLVTPAGESVAGATFENPYIKEAAFSDVWSFGGKTAPKAEMLVLAAPTTGHYRLELAPAAGASRSTPFTISLLLPEGDGLRQVVFSDLTGSDRPAPVTFSSSTLQIVWRTSTPAGDPKPATLNALIQPPALAPIGVVQQAHADELACSTEEEGISIGRVIAVLLNREVDPASAADLSHFGVDANAVLDTKLQPDQRVLFAALRDPVGPFVPRSLTISDLADAHGAVMTSSVTLPIEMTVSEEGGQLTGRVYQPNGTPAESAKVQLLYYLSCNENVFEDPKWIRVSEHDTDAAGAYGWDYVSRGLPGRLIIEDPITDGSRDIRFNVQRAGQRLNIDIVFLGRGTLKGVTRDAQGNLLAGTAIRVTSLTDDSQYGATTGANGEFLITGIPVGNLFIEAVNVAANAQTTASEHMPAESAVITRDLSLISRTSPEVTVQYGTLTGRVLRADGQTPAANLPVYAFYKANSQPNVGCDKGGTECAVAAMRTSETGAFRFDRVPAGQLRVYSLDQSLYQEGSASTVLFSSGTKDVTVLLRGGFGTVTGKVVNAAGLPVAGARVGGGPTLATTDAQGIFSLADMPVGTRRIVAVSDAMGAEASADVTVARAGDTANVLLVMPAVGAIAGTVLGTDGTTPVRNNDVFLFTRNYNGSVNLIQSGRTDANGAFRFDNIASGEYQLSAFNASFTAGNILPVVVKYQNQIVRTVLRFRGSGGRVQGMVFESSGTSRVPLRAKVGVSGDQVVLADGRIGVEFRAVKNYQIVETGDDGRYELTGVWVGSFTVQAAGAFSPDPVSGAGFIPTPGATATLDLRLEPTSDIRGRVVRADGLTPVGANVPVRYKSEAYRMVCTDDGYGDSTCTPVPTGIQEEDVVTDANGEFWLPVVSSGSFSVIVNDGQGGVAKAYGSVGAGQTGRITVRLLHRAPVHVEVVGSDGFTPIADAQVRLTQPGYPHLDATFVTDAQGRVSFDGAEMPYQGSVLIHARNPSNGFSARVERTIAFDTEAVAVRVALSDATGSVSGTVLGPDRFTPKALTEVVISNAGGGLAYVVTDSSGRFQADMIPLGAFRVDTFEAATSRTGSAQGRIDVRNQAVSVNVIQNSLGVVTGTALEEDTLAPLAGWEATLGASGAGRLSRELSATTGVDGRFRFPGVPVGPVQASVKQPDGAGQGSAEGRLEREGQLLDLPVLVKNIRVFTGGVEGVVRNANGSPAANVAVEVCSPVGCGGAVQRLTTDNEGRFSADGVSLGRFEVRARSQVNENRGTAYGEIVFANEVSSVTVTMIGLTQITGIVRHGDQSPASGVQVRLLGIPSSGCEGACVVTTGSSGTFTFSDVPARSFTITARDVLSSLNGVVGGALVTGESKSVEIVLENTFSLRGRALTESGRPAAGIGVELFARVGQPNVRSLYALADSSGVFVFDVVPPGPFEIKLEDPVGTGLARQTGELFANRDLGDIVLDESAPQVLVTSPSASAIEVPLQSQIRVTFANPIDAATKDLVQLETSSGPVAVVATLEDSDRVVVLTPAAALAESTEYFIRVNGVRDPFGRTMTLPYSASFLTLDRTAPAWAEIFPAPNATTVALDTVIRLTASEPLDPARSGDISVRAGGTALSGRTDYTNGNRVVVFTPSRPLSLSTTYTVSVSSVTDRSGNAQTSPLSFTFSTTDGRGPTITSLVTTSSGTVVERTNVTATAAVDLPTAFVEFYINGTLVSTQRAEPYQFAFVAGPEFGTPGATLRLTAAATGTSGVRGPTSSAVTLLVVADANPTAAITAPAPGRIVNTGERVEVTLQASDDIGITQMAFRANNATFETRTLPAGTRQRTETFAFVVPTNAVPQSSIAIEARVTDTAGHMVAASSVSVVVRDVQPPTVALSGKVSGQPIRANESLTLLVSATDSGHLREIGLRASGLLVRQSSQTVANTPSGAASFTFVVPDSVTTGQTLTLQAYAIDQAGNEGRAPTILLPVADHQTPLVTLQTETGRLEVDRGETVYVVVSATDNIAVSQLSLAASGAMQYAEGKQVSPPKPSTTMTFALPIPETLAAGAQIQLTAQAVDTTQNTSTSTVLSLQVSQAVPFTITLPPSLVLQAGQRADVSVVLSTPAPAGGLTVTFDSSDVSVATVTPSAFFEAGTTTGTVSVSALRGGSSSIGAKVGDIRRAQMTVTVAGGLVSGVARWTDPTDGQIKPAANAKVTVQSGGVTLSTTTNAAGRYFVQGAPGLEVTVKVLDPVTSYRGVAIDHMDVPFGQMEMDVMLISAGSILGKVLLADATTSVGLGVNVKLFETGAAMPLAQAFTSADGSFEFPLVNPGNFILEASSGANRGRGYAAIDFSGLDAQVAISFLGLGTVKGTVRDGAGQPVANANLEFRATSLFGDANPEIRSANAQGQYEFTRVFVGDFTLQARDGDTGLGGVVRGSLQQHGETIVKDVQLAPFGRVQGTVYRADGVTLERQALVTLNDGQQRRSADDGSFLFSVVSPGAITVTATRPETHFFARSTTTVSGHGDVATVQLTGVPQRSVLVTVEHQDGRRSVGARVSLAVRDDQFSDSFAGNANAEGQIAFSPVLIGSYDVVATSGTLSGSAFGVLTSSDTTRSTTVTLSAEPPPPGTSVIRGKVYEPDGVTPAQSGAVNLEWGQ
jgi:hypothetical protein